MQNSSLAFAKEGSLTPKLNSSKSAVCPGNRPALHFHTDSTQVIPLFKTCTRLNPGWEAELQFLLKSLGFGGLHIFWVAFIKLRRFWYFYAPPAYSMNISVSPVQGVLQPWVLPAAGCQDCPGMFGVFLLLNLLGCRSLLLLLQWHFCLFRRAQDPLLLKKHIVQKPGNFQVFEEAAYSLHRLLLSAIFWCSPCLRKGRFLLGLGAFWRERSFLLTHSDR